MDKKWFEMEDIIKHPLKDKTWIPLFWFESKKNDILNNHAGFLEEYFGCAAVMFPAGFKENALKLGWADVGLHSHHFDYKDDLYIRSDVFIDYKTQEKGEFLVLKQNFETGENPEWHLDQELVMALKLNRESDIWVCPDEDYVEVVRMYRDKNGSPKKIEMRAEHLKDYLNARNSGLLLSTYFSRVSVKNEFVDMNWENGNSEKIIAGGKWEGRLTEIHEGGGRFGQPISVFRLTRNDVDPEIDVPTFEDPYEDNVESQVGRISNRRPKLVNGQGEMWRNEWVEPGDQSYRIRGDKLLSKIPFFIENDGSTAVSDELLGATRWLWFKPAVINSLLEKRRGSLKWLSEETGCVGSAPNTIVHFGVNKSGYINVFAKDIAQLNESNKRLWVAHNETPEGGVCEELLAVQMKCEMLKTLAPENEFLKALKMVDDAFKKQFGCHLFKTHSKEKELFSEIHRFKSLDFNGFCNLAKEMTRLIIDRFDFNSLKSLTSGENKNLRSIKRLEKLLDSIGKNGRELAAPLVGITELRHADAHLPSKDYSEKMALVGIEDDGNYLEMGKKLIKNIANCLTEICEALNNQ